MRLVFVSIEFSAGTFSGNGIYATSQVPGWSRHHCCFTNKQLTYVLGDCLCRFVR